jgi:ribose 1,5-bisphosphokinase PhnN
MSFTPRVFVVVGGPGSGKDILLRAVRDLGSQHALIVPKHTDREANPDDGDEMICFGQPGYDLENCDVKYKNFKKSYGFKCSLIWAGLRQGVHQVIVVSNIKAINKLKENFGDLLVLLYVHSEINREEFQHEIENHDKGYIRERLKGFDNAFIDYLNNYNTFRHVLIYAGAPEDLFDQIFRLFRAYEHRAIN